MKATELMIGDWVKIQGYDGLRITAINKSYVNFDKRWAGAKLGEINPIPLTVEILEKNGFVKYNEVSDTPPYDQDEEGNMYYSYNGEHKFWGWWQPNNVYFIPINAMLDLEIKFVHELQHALRLCGIDKVITI